MRAVAINPSLRVQQVQLPDHFINVNFMQIPKVDRCTTCHVAADRKGFDDPKIREVYRTHPRMHRMVGSESMHPAQSFGCTLHGRPLGAAANATVTSFFPSKPLGGYGDGGALLTESDERAALYRSLRTHGEGTSRYEVLHTGMNGRLDSMQAAVLLAKLTVFTDELASRERVARYYDSRLGNAVVTPARTQSFAKARKPGSSDARSPRSSPTCGPSGVIASGPFISPAGNPSSSSGTPG